MSFEDAIKLSELEKAAVQCSRGLLYKASVSGYLRDSLSRNNRLQNELLNGNYKISKYLQFTIIEPKKRDICATRMRDRVWQKSMCNNGVREQLLKPLIYDNGACQKNKGVDFDIDRCICFLQKFYRKHKSNHGYYTHLDVKGYFPNTPHRETKRVVDEYVNDNRLRAHIYNIIDSFKDPRMPEDIAADPFGPRGTALGSEISQLLQLAVPNHIDHAIKEILGVKYYIRFNDDMLLIDSDVNKLNAVADYITDEYAKLGLVVTVKQKNEPIRKGIKFLKRRIVLTDTGKVLVFPEQGKIGKERRRLRKMKAKLATGEITMAKIEDHYQSVRAGIARCDAKSKINALDMFYEKLFGIKPPRQKGKKKNAYCKTKSANRAARGAARKNAGRERKTKGADRVHRSDGLPGNSGR